MSDDPLDSPPVDHGSDRYDYVEVDAPPGIDPPPELLAQIDNPPCPDCRANLFVRYVGRLEIDPLGELNFWRATIAHDETCPTLARIERERTE